MCYRCARCFGLVRWTSVRRSGKNAEAMVSLHSTIMANKIHQPRISVVVRRTHEPSVRTRCRQLEIFGTVVGPFIAGSAQMTKLICPQCLQEILTTLWA